MGRYWWGGGVGGGGGTCAYVASRLCFINMFSYLFLISLCSLFFVFFFLCLIWCFVYKLSNYVSITACLPPSFLFLLFLFFCSIFVLSSYSSPPFLSSSSSPSSYSCLFNFPFFLPSFFVLVIIFISCRQSTFTFLVQICANLFISISSLVIPSSTSISENCKNFYHTF